MVYRRRKTGTKRPYKRKVLSKRTGWGSIAQKALRTAKFVAKLVNAESKYFDLSQATASPTYNGTIYSLCAPVQGIGALQRTGDSIKIQKIVIRGEIFYGSTNPDIIRIIVFNDKQVAITNINTLLQVTGSGAVIVSPKHEDYKYDSKFLMDKTFTVDAYHSLHKFDWVIPFSKHVHFTAGTTTITNDSIKIAIISSSAGNSNAVTFYSRVTFLDN